MYSSDRRLKHLFAETFKCSLSLLTLTELEGGGGSKALNLILQMSYHNTKLSKWLSVIVIQFTFGNLSEEWIFSVAFDSYDYSRNSRRNVEIVEIQFRF